VQAFDAHKPDGCNVDPSVSDAARIMRVPGSINTSSENVVVEFYRCSTANYTLVELANLLEVKPEKTRLIPGECSAAKRKAGRARWSNPLQSFFQLWRKRGTFSVGTRHGALFVLCYLARRNGWREGRIRTYAEKLISDCDPVLSMVDIEECLASSRRACAKPWSMSLRNRTICNMLRITTAEERRMFIKPPRKPRAMVLGERHEEVMRRRKLIVQELLWAGRNVSGRDMTRLLLEKHGLRVSHATVAVDLASTTVRSATVQLGCASATAFKNTQQKLTGQPKPPVGSSEASGQSNIPKKKARVGFVRPPGVSTLPIERAGLTPVSALHSLLMTTGSEPTTAKEDQKTKMQTTLWTKCRSEMLQTASQPGWALAIHESGHAVTTCELGFGLKKRGIEIMGREGMTYSRSPGLRSRNPELRQRFCEGNIVVGLAGPVAEYRVNENLVHIDGDVENIAVTMRELLPRKNHFVQNACGYGESWGDFWALIYTLATCPDEKKALAELDEFPGLAAIDMSIFRILWPLAQKTHAIIDRNWSKVEEISTELIKNGRLSGHECEGLWARNAAQPAASWSLGKNETLSSV
jgi:hypothetical protein